MSNSDDLSEAPSEATDKSCAVSATRWFNLGNAAF